MINRRLYDLLIRHQIYVEGFKNFQSNEFRKLLPQFIRDLKAQFAISNVNTLDEMTKREVQRFKRNVAQVNKRFGDYWNKQLLKTFEEFLAADFFVNKEILGNYLLGSDDVFNDDVLNSIIKKNASTEQENKLAKPIWIYDNKTNKIKDVAFDSIVPAFGLLPEEMVDNFTDSIDEKIQMEINKGWADNKPLDEILDDIVGTKDNNYKDGLLLGFERGNGVVLSTIIQHLSSIVAVSVFGIVYNKYVWVSVIDSATSDICISRNLKVYTYGNGPLPPAHPKCRSKTVPFTGRGDIPHETFPQWSDAQPADIQKYISDKFPALSLESFGNKIDSILTR